MTRRTLGWLLAAVAVVLSSATPAAAGTAPLPAPSTVVVVGAPGLAWTDVEPTVTPVLAGLVEDGATGSMTVRAVRSRSCALDGWLTLSAGRRAADLPGPCREPGPVGADGRVPGWSDVERAAREASYGATPGLLATRLVDAGACVRSVGRGAAVGAATTDGVVTDHAPGLPATFGCALTLVDGGALPTDDAPRRAALAELDALLGRVLDRLPNDGAVVVAGVGDGPSPIRPRLLLVAGTGPAELGSPSTRQPGLVQLQDLTATLLAWAGADDAGVSGRPLTVSPDDRPAADRVAERRGFEVRAGTLRSVSPQVTGWLAVAFALWCAAVVVLRWRRRDADPPGPLLVAGVALAAVPGATFVANLVPWWSVGAPAVVFTVVLAVVVAATTALAVLAARRAPLGAALVVGGVGALVLLADVLAGSRLQLASVFGQNPTVGGRFYGFGNTSFAVYGTGVLVLVHAVATTRGLPRRVATVAGAALLVLALGVEAHPSLGADFGGPPGLLLGGLVVLAAAAGIALRPVRVTAAVLAAGALTVGVAVLDWLRPPGARTHLGDFVQTVLDGAAGDVLTRKLAQNLANLGVPALVVVAVAAAVLGVTLWRTGWRPAPGGALLLRAAAVMGGVAFAINDSGLVIPAFVALVLLPLVLAERLHGGRVTGHPDDGSDRS